LVANDLPGIFTCDELDRQRGRGELRMVKKTLAFVLAGAVLMAIAAPGWAQQSNGEKRVVKGPSKTSFGRLDVVLPEGTSSEVEYQPDASRLVVRTLAGEARIITSAQYLVLVEAVRGKVEVLLSTGRVIAVEPGKAEIVGRALVDDPGQIVIRLSGIGPLAQAGGPFPAGSSEVVATVLEGLPATALGVVQETPRANTVTDKDPESNIQSISGSAPAVQGFGRTATP